MTPVSAGNQSPDPLIDFPTARIMSADGWESVTRPLDRLPLGLPLLDEALGISHQTP